MNLGLPKLRLTVMVSIVACAVGLPGCGGSGDDQKRGQLETQQYEQYQRQLEKIELEDKRRDVLLAQSEEQSRRADALDEKYAALLAKWEEQARLQDEMNARYKALLDRWENQTKRTGELLEHISRAVESHP